MAAYAALISLTHILHQILHPPPLNKIIIDREQIEFLREKVNFLIDFLETYSSRRSEEIADLETRIADAAYAAEDIIESNVVEQIRATRGEDISTLLCEGIQRVLEEFLSIEKELMKMGDMGALQPKSIAIVTTTSSGPLPGGKITMVGFEKRVNEIMGVLATNESNRLIIPIVGMGGIGKTTLATAVYNNAFIVEHFHVRAWVTVSQEYTVRELLLRLLSEINRPGPNKEESTDDELGLQLYKELFHRKYLIVMDDMWNIQAWEKLKMFLPYNENGSRILVTTRLANLAVEFESCTPYKMDFLDEEQSLDLLRKKIFPEKDCPDELEEIGKDIAKKCGGLPLALVVIGGLLAKSERTREHLEFVARDMTSALNYGNDEHLMKILSLSYIHLPLYLKPCFIYLSVFPKAFEIRVSTLIKLWVAEGLIKHTQAKCLEEIANEYLEDFISRNLILVHRRGNSGKVKCCKIHDLLRDLCFIQAEREKFLHIAKLDNPNISPNIETKRRLSIYSPSKPVEITASEAMQLVKFNRSWLSHGEFSGSSLWIPKGSVGGPSKEWTVNQIIHGFRLLKVMHVEDYETRIEILTLTNLRYVVASSVNPLSSMYLCWNLQTLVCGKSITLPVEIWQMPQLRHLTMYRITLPDPPNDHNVIVLENLQTLTTIENFKCTEQVSERIPNLKKLRILYGFRSSAACEQVGSYCLKNLVYLKKLESLGIEGEKKLWMDIAFPISLKKLSLQECKIPWDDLSIIGSLPNLEVLKLYANATEGEEWNPIEGEFCRLKFLLIWRCELKIWGAENSHFPSLERLVLKDITRLKEIPMSFAEILTLQVIELFMVEYSLWTSARQISDERELLGYEPLQVQHYNRSSNYYVELSEQMRIWDEQNIIMKASLKVWE